MKINALITMLVLGSSSAAMAKPVTVSAHAEWTFGTRPAPVVVRDHRRPVRWNSGGGYYNNHYYQAPQAVMIGNGLHFGSDGRTFIPVGAAQGRFNTLRIDGNGGASYIQQVAIEFEYGQVQVIRDLNRVLDGSRPLMIDLDGNARTIVRVVVYGKPQYPQGPNYRIMAPTFSVSAL